MATTCVLELRSAEDPLLRAAAEDGMGSALLVPINDGGDTIAMLELLSRSTTAPNAGADGLPRSRSPCSSGWSRSC